MNPLDIVIWVTSTVTCVVCASFTSVFCSWIVPAEKEGMKFCEEKKKQITPADIREFMIKSLQKQH